MRITFLAAAALLAGLVACTSTPVPSPSASVVLATPSVAPATPSVAPLTFAPFTPSPTLVVTVAPLSPTPPRPVATPTTAPATPTRPPATRTPTPTPTVAPTNPPPPTETPIAPPPTPGTGGPTLRGACLTMSNEPLEGYDRQLLLDASFEEEDLQGFSVAVTGANGGQPVDATEVTAGLFQAALGVNGSTPSSELEIALAQVTGANGNVHDVMAAVTESIGSIPNNFGPGDSVGDSCGGFPE